MEKRIWCYACAAHMGLNEGDLRSDWRTVRWGFVSRPDLACDECGCELSGGSFAACVTLHLGKGEYCPWEGRVLIPQEVCDEDLEHEPNPEIRGYLAHYREIQAFDLGRCHGASSSDQPRNIRGVERGGEGVTGQDTTEKDGVVERRPTAAAIERSHGTSHLEATAAVEVSSTVMFRVTLVLGAAAGVMLGLALLGG